ncbi:MAG: hypothetical protein AAFQ37_08830 [Bacteroidota bacterium]
MRKSPVNFQPLFVLVNLFFVGCLLTLIYLLIGDHLPTVFDRPEPLSSTNSSSNSTIQKTDADEVVDGIHVATGLVYAEGFDIVRGTCTACHSAKLVTQNRATRAGWSQMIHWMQETQGLWDLGEQEPIILDYLATHYAPEEEGRRANLDVEAIEWYVLELE